MGTNTNDNILELRDVSVEFEMDMGRSRVVDDINIDIYRREILGVVGESGSGKSMFASSLLDAVVDPGLTVGEIMYSPLEGDEIDVLSLSDSELRNLRWEDIAMVFQGAQSSFNPTLSIRGHFLETMDAHGLGRTEGMKQVRSLLSELQLDPERVLDSYPHELSGGMKQRALIGLSLLLEPEVLVLDEPTAALDLLMQRSIINLLDRLQEKYELTIVFITHDLPLLTKLADRLAIMYAFEFVEIGTTDDILSHAKHPYTRMLLKSTPNVSLPIDEMQPIKGDSPDPVATPSGCRFHPRCPLADGKCQDVKPALVDEGDTQQVSCHYSDESSEAIPTTWEK